MLSVVMLHYGGGQLPMAQQALGAVREHTSGEPEIIFWRNGDHPYERGTVERLGLAEAYNLAVQQTSGELLCFIHNDAFVSLGWDKALRVEAMKGNIAFPRVKTNDDIASVRGVPPVPEWMPPSCCFMLKRELWNDLGGYDEIFEGCHFEDMDLFKRAEKAGASLVQCDSDVMHIRGATRMSYVDDCNDAFRINERIYAKRYGERDGDEIRYELPILKLIGYDKQEISEVQ